MQLIREAYWDFSSKNFVVFLDAFLTQDVSTGIRMREKVVTSIFPSPIKRKLQVRLMCSVPKKVIQY